VNVGATPEGRVKKMIREVLDSTKELHYDMPVQGGYGPALLDFYVCHRGRYCAIEAKAPGNHPTNRQYTIIQKIRDSGGKVFIIDGPEEIKHLRAWLNGLVD
jgi:hypothetical protein